MACFLFMCSLIKLRKFFNKGKIIHHHDFDQGKTQKFVSGFIEPQNCQKDQAEHEFHLSVKVGQEQVTNEGDSVFLFI